MKIKGLLFDKDGTLFDFERTWGVWFDRVISELAAGDLALERRLARSCGYDIEKQQFVAGSVIVTATAEQVNAALAACLPKTTIEQVDAVARRHVSKLPYVPVCGLRQLLLDLRAMGYAIGLATNDYHEGALKQLQDAGISDLFEFVCGSDSGYGGKPGTGMVHAFCEITGLEVSAVAVVGDSVHDLEAGSAAGVGCRIGVLTGPASREDLGPFSDVVLDSIAQLTAPDIQNHLRGKV